MEVHRTDGTVVEFNTSDVDYVAFSVFVDGHKFVDLGLPSGLLWAETNVGATAAADYGNYYAWGETVAKTSYNWSDYKYGSSRTNIAKYNASDGITLLDAADDAATTNWGTACRVPTKDEFDELADNCTWTWTSQTASNGTLVDGYKITGKNGNSIFLPATGAYDGEIFCEGSIGFYWLSTLSADDYGLACGFNFYNGNYFGSNYYRYYGFAVRPVVEP